MIDWAEMNRAIREVTRNYLRDTAIRELMAPEPWLVRILRNNRKHEDKIRDEARWADDGGKL